MWRYNPQDKSYVGLPELKPKPKAAVRKIAPMAAPQGTVLMKSPVAPGGALSQANAEERKSRNRRYLWVILGLVVGVLVAGGLSLVI